MLFVPVLELGALAINPRTGGAGPVNVMVTYVRDPGKMFLSIPMDYTTHPPQPEGLSWIVYAEARFAGLIAPFPLAARITDGI